ncbi:MAG: diguanylate cyclase, partial [Intestinibacillus sp.]
MLPILAILIVQALLYFLVFMQGNVLSRMDQNAYEILNERTINRKLYVESEMIHRWSNVEESEAAVLDQIAQTLSREGRTYTDIAGDAALNQRIVADVAPDIIYLLRRNLSTGAFLILDGPGLASDPTGTTRAGFYIRDLDPTNYDSNNGDLLLERGMPDISKSMQLVLDRFWTSTFTFSGNGSPDERFFCEPLNAARASENKDSANFGYWCAGYRLNVNDLRAISYSIPLIAPDGTVFGVLGVELNQSYLQDILTYSELGGAQRSAYLLGIMDSNTNTITPVLSSGPYYNTQFGENTLLTLDSAGDDAYTVSSDQLAAKKLVMSLAQFHLYNANTPFAHQQWVLAGIVAREDLLAFSHQIERNAILSVLLCFLFAICSLLVAGRAITQPLISLVHDLERSDPNRPIVLRKIHIGEIDHLSGAIERLSGAVAESASRFSEILRLTGVQLAVFEYTDGQPTVFCSDNIYTLLGWSPPAPGTALSREEFLARMKALEQHRYEDETSTYLLELPTSFRWIKVTWLHEGDHHLGAVSDVTYETLEKRKVEYERDFDTLTDLYNRRAFDRQLDQLFRTPETLGVAALMMWDLDNLKFINDTYGHDYGDLYIKSFAQAINLHEPKHMIAARRSGDEFYVFLYGYRTQQEARAQIDHIARRVTNSFFLLPGGTR